MRIDGVVRSITQPQPTGTKPSALSITESMKAQENANAQGVSNLKDAVNLANTAEASLSTVSDTLQQLHDLASQALNDTLTDDDKQIIQQQANELLTDISDNLQRTEFNTLKLFDGFSGNVQGGAENQGRTMEIANTSLQTLGLDSFDVTDPNALTDVQEAISTVNQSRANIGAQTNGIESAIRSNDVARENTLASRSKYDEDFAKQITELKRQQITQQYQYQLQNKESEDQKNTLNLLTF